MPAGLTVPTIFTAVDRLSSVVSRMSKSVNTFAGKAQAGVARVNAKFNSLVPGYNSLKSAIMGYAGAAVLAGAIIGGVTFGAQSLIDYEKNVAALRIVLNDLTNKEFKQYENGITNVARTTRASSVDVAASFAKIAELNYELAKSPASLASVSKAAIVLSRAAGEDLVPSTEGLVGILSQFQLEGTQANRVINTLAAGLKYGSASIMDQVEAYRVVGPVAKSANLTLEQSTAILQTLAKFQIKGAEAGTAFRNVILRTQKAGAGYASGIYNINDAFGQVQKKLNQLGSERKKNAFLQDLFGVRVITGGRIIGENALLTAKLTKEVTGTNEAYKQAAIRVDTVAGRWDQLKATMVTYLTTNEKAGKGMTKLRGILKYVADNFDDIIDKVITAAKWFLYIKGALKLAQAAFWLWSVGMKIGAAANWIWNASAVAINFTVGAMPWIFRAASEAAAGFGYVMESVRGIMAAWNITAAGVGKSFRWAATIYLAVIAIKSLLDNWETVKQSFSSGNWMTGFAQAIRAGVIIPLMELGSLLDKLLKFTGIDVGAHFPETAQDKSDYVQTGTWGDNRAQPLIMPMAQATLSQGAASNSMEKQLGQVGITVFTPDGAKVETSSKGSLIGGIKLSSTTGQK